MRLFLDTSVLIRMSQAPERVPRNVLDVLRPTNVEALISTITWYEIDWKTRLGKLPRTISEGLDAAADAMFSVRIPVTAEHARLAAALPGDIRDPFDRIIAAQAISEGCRIVSPDTAFDALGADRLWS